MSILSDMRPTVGFASAPATRADFAAATNARGRGATGNIANRYEREFRLPMDDGWDSLEDLPLVDTGVIPEVAKSIISRNESPDISFDQSVNPYRGCEHGCSYCYARPTHAYMGLSPGLDFETRLFAKMNAPELLREELSAPGYVPKTIALGANTDTYQPIERKHRLTRRVLEVLAEFNHPVGIVTKSALVARDIDILKPMAEQGLVKVAISLTTLDAKLSRAMEPRAPTPARRLAAIELLAAAGVPVVAMVAPVIPALNDSEIEAILKSASAAGAFAATYVMLRLPLEVRDIFQQWLYANFPDRAPRVMALVRNVRGGRDNDSTFGRRMTGTGPYAWMIGRRFELACRKLGLNARKVTLAADRFRRPPQPGEQLTLL